MYRPRSTYEWIFLGLMSAQALITTGFDLYLLIRYYKWVNDTAFEVPRGYVIPIHSAIFILGEAVLVAIAYDALRAKNSLELIGICCFDIVIFVFSILRLPQSVENAQLLVPNVNQFGIPSTKQDTDDFIGVISPTLTISIVVVGICVVACCYLVWKLSDEFAWAIYRQVSGNIQARKRYLAYQVLLVFLKLEIFPFFSFLIMYGFINVHYMLPEFPLTMLLMPALLVLVALTIYAIKYESMLLSVLALTLRLASMAYLVAMLYFHTNRKNWRWNTALRNELHFFSGVALVLGFACFINALVCIRNFGHGLKTILLDSSWKQDSRSFTPMHAQTRYAERLELD